MAGKKRPAKKSASKKAARGPRAKVQKGPLTEVERLMKNPEELQLRVLNLAHDSAFFTAYFAAMNEGAARSLADVPPELLAQLEQAREAAATAAHDMDNVFLHRIERPLREVNADQLRSAIRAHRASAAAIEGALRSVGAPEQP
jgi:hypothetical protein